MMSAAFGMLMAVGVATIQSNADVIAANDGVVQTYQVRGEIDNFVEEVARMESSVRGFVITGETVFRTRADDHRNAIIERLRILKDLVAGNPAQVARVARIEALSEEKFAQSSGLIRARQAGGMAAAAQTMSELLALPEHRTSALVQLADEVRAAENRLLATRTLERRALELNAREVELIGILIAVGLLCAAALLAQRAEAASKRSCAVSWEPHLRRRC